ncbi:MAG: hypothetical protein U1E61_07855 [Bradyrhizobium sp.]
MPSNVVMFDAPANQAPSAFTPSATVADLENSIANIVEMTTETREQMHRAISLLDLSNAQAQRLIAGLEDLQTRSRLMARSERINELIKTARLKAGAL